MESISCYFFSLLDLFSLWQIEVFLEWGNLRDIKKFKLYRRKKKQTDTGSYIYEEIAFPIINSI